MFQNQAQQNTNDSWLIDMSFPGHQYVNISSGAVSIIYSVIGMETNGGWFSATMSSRETASVSGYELPQ